MFKQVTLSHFKSIREPVSIDLGHLTVMTGSNSSGKSTVLQSLLLLAQTLRHSGTDRHLVLNGPLARLGELSDVVNPPNGPDCVGISISIEPGRPVVTDSDTPQNIIRRTQYPEHISAQWTFTDRALQPDMAGGVTRSFPTVDTFGLEATFDTDAPLDPIALSITRHRWRPETRYVREGYVSGISDSLVNALAWSVELDYRDTLDPHDRPKRDIRGVVFDHCLPGQFATRIDIVQEFASVTLRSLRQSTRPQGSLDKITVHPILWRLLLQHAIRGTDIAEPSLSKEPTVGEVRAWADGLGRVERRRFNQSLAVHSDHILNTFRKNHEPENWLTSDDMPALLERSVGAVRSELAAVRYLGPLRIQPAPLYPVATTLGSEDVGPSGEWTASVLDTYKHTVVSYMHPSSLPFDSEKPKLRNGTLAIAVNQWMAYLGVSGAVETVDRGSLGHQLTVHAPTASRGLPLTHVGVGVSQCLPVVVSLLLARPNTMTLLEQPELHLHPAVQSRLADFLLAMALSGRQCLVETHSEYLVSRLRLRTAEASGTAVGDRIRIYFASIQGGASHFESVAVNEFGAITNWPRGFFDEAQGDLEGLLRASAAKRAESRQRARRT